MNEKELKQLKKLALLRTEPLVALFDELQALNRGIRKLSKSDLLESFESVITYLKKMEEKMNKWATETKDEITALGEKIKTDVSKDVDEVKEKLEALLARIPNLIADYQSKLAPIFSELETIRGKIEEVSVVNELELEQKILAKIPAQEKIDLSILLPTFGGAIRQGLETLEGNDRLDKSAVKGLEEEMEKLRDIISKIPRGKVMGRAKTQVVRRIRLTADADGENRTFTLPPDTVDVLGIWSSQFPFTMDTNDWTLNGNVLTLGDEVPAIQRGQTLMALVDVLFYP